MVLENAYSMWTERRLTQEQAAELLRVSARPAANKVDELISMAKMHSEQGSF